MAHGPISTLDGAPTIEMRVCSKCKQRKPATEEHFYRHKTGSHAGKLFTWCKSCFSVHASEYRILKDGRKEALRTFVDRPSDLPYTEKIETKPTKDGFRKKKRTFAPENILNLCKETIEILFGKCQIEKTGDEFEIIQKKAMDKLEKILTYSLVGQAVGYYVEEEKIKYVRSTVDGGWVATEKYITKEYQPGNATLFTLLVTNKFPDKWKVSRELLTGKAEGYDSKPSQRIRKVIESLGRDVFEQNTDRPETEHSVSGGLAPIPVGNAENDKK